MVCYQGNWIIEILSPILIDWVAYETKLVSQMRNPICQVGKLKMIAIACSSTVRVNPISI